MSRYIYGALFALVFAVFANPTAAQSFPAACVRFFSRWICC